MSQSCVKRSVVYETWCGTCEKRDKIKEGNTKVQPRVEGNTGQAQVEVQLHKYIGESSRSIYERGMEHILDANSLNS